MTRPSAQEVREQYFGELKPCPFCGEKPKIITMPEGQGSCDGSMYVECSNKLCRSSSALIYPLKCDVREQLIQRWNRRIND